MSQFYGLLAGLFVAGATWGISTYVSAQSGWLAGLFLVVFFTVTTIYIQGDEVNDRQRSVLNTLSGMEVAILERLKTLDETLKSLQSPSRPEVTGAIRQSDLDGMIGLVQDILRDETAARSPKGAPQRDRVEPLAPPSEVALGPPSAPESS